MSLNKTRRKSYILPVVVLILWKKEFLTFGLAEFCREGIFIGRNFMIYVKSFFCFDASKCCCCNYKLAWKTSQYATCIAFFFNCILLSLQKHPLEVFYKKTSSLNFCNIYRKTTALEFLFNFIIMKLQHRCSPVNIAKFLENTF